LIGKGSDRSQTLEEFLLRGILSEFRKGSENVRKSSEKTKTLAGVRSRDSQPASKSDKGEAAVPKVKNLSASLSGWKEIATFLGQPLSVAQRWAKSGMPVTRDGRRVHASPEDLNRWLGRESSGEPVHIATESEDLAAGLKRRLSYVRKHVRKHVRK
jgi:hypothetical protein